MRGLIIKDYYCLRMSIKTVICVSAFSLIISVMCIMSMKNGNLAVLSTGVVDGMDQSMVATVWRMILSLLFILPMALLGNVTQCFAMDKKADFEKTEGTMPLSAFQIVTARYITLILFGGATFLFSVLLAALCGLLSVEFTVSELVCTNITLAGILLATVALTSFVLFAVNIKCGDLLLGLPIFIGILH